MPKVSKADERRWRARLAKPGPMRPPKRREAQPVVPAGETKRGWQDRHGGKDAAILDEEEGVWLYRDGATDEGGAHGRLKEPPANAHARAKLVLRYWELVYRNAAAVFEAERDQLKDAKHAALRQGYPPPGDRELEALRKLRDEARQLRARMQAAAAEVERTEPHQAKHLRRLRDEGDDRRASQYREFERELSRIKL